MPAARAAASISAPGNLIVAFAFGAVVDNQP
jgi:hypothetical protein